MIQSLCVETVEKRALSVSRYDKNNINSLGFRGYAGYALKSEATYMVDWLTGTATLPFNVTSPEATRKWYRKALKAQVVRPKITSVSLKVLPTILQRPVKLYLRYIAKFNEFKMTCIADSGVLGDTVSEILVVHCEKPGTRFSRSYVCEITEHDNDFSVL